MTRALKPAKAISVILAVLLMALRIPASAAQFIRSEGEESVYSWHKNSSNKIALTFDDGPHPCYTEEILGILDEFDVKATFFVIGKNAEKYPDILQHVIDSGHEIGNHTFSHANLRALNEKNITEELERTQEIIYETGEYGTKLIRPPEGKYSPAMTKLAEKMEYSIVLWTVDTRDWAHTPSDKIYDNVTKSIKSGDIILFHDGIVGSSPTPEALRRIIPELKNMGFSLVTVSELLGSS